MVSPTSAPIHSRILRTFSRASAGRDTSLGGAAPIACWEKERSTYKRRQRWAKSENDPPCKRAPGLPRGGGARGPGIIPLAADSRGRGSRRRVREQSQPCTRPRQQSQATRTQCCRPTVRCGSSPSATPTNASHGCLVSAKRAQETIMRHRSLQLQSQRPRHPAKIGSVT